VGAFSTTSMVKNVLNAPSVVSNMTIKVRQCPQTRIMDLEEENATLLKATLSSRETISLLASGHEKELSEQASKFKETQEFLVNSNIRLVEELDQRRQKNANYIKEIADMKVDLLFLRSVIERILK
jgi:hypothetical protein